LLELAALEVEGLDGALVEGGGRRGLGGGLGGVGGLAGAEDEGEGQRDQEEEGVAHGVSSRIIVSNFPFSVIKLGRAKQFLPAYSAGDGGWGGALAAERVLVVASREEVPLLRQGDLRG